MHEPDQLEQEKTMSTRHALPTFTAHTGEALVSTMRGMLEGCEERIEAKRAERRLMTDQRAADTLRKFREMGMPVIPRPNR